MEIKAYNAIVNAVYELTSTKNIIKAHSHFRRSGIKPYIYTVPVLKYTFEGIQRPKASSGLILLLCENPRSGNPCILNTIPLLAYRAKLPFLLT